MYIGTKHLYNYHANLSWIASNIKKKLEDTLEYKAIDI